jgi:apolipoprotein N-acyltransferase
MLSALETSFLVLLGGAAAAASRLRGWPVWTAALWVAVETWRAGWPFGGMPWGRLAFATAGTPYGEALPYVGATGVSLLVALTGTMLAWAVMTVRVRPRRVLPALFALAAVIALPAVAPYTAAADGAVTVAAVQGDVPGDGTDILYDHRQVSRNHVDVTLRLAEDAAEGRVRAPDFVVWPENSTAVDPFLDGSLNGEVWQAVRAVGAPVLVGAITEDPEPGKILNQGIVWTPTTGAADRYTKRHPVPYGEYIPWRDSNPLTERFARLARVGRDMQAGTRVDPLRIAGIEVGDAICFDVAYDEGLYGQVRGGARMLVVQTSNATFSRTSQLEQQFEITRVRAMESARYLAVASTNGITGVIAPDGRVVYRLPRSSQGYLVERVPLTSAMPPGIRIGPWLGLGSVVVGVLALALPLVPYRRRSGDDPQRSAAPERDPALAP